MIKAKMEELLKRKVTFETKHKWLVQQLVDCIDSKSAQKIKYKKAACMSKLTSIENELIKLRKKAEAKQSPSVQTETVDSEQAPFSRLVAC